MNLHRSLETILEICDFIDRHRLPFHRLASMATGQAVVIPAGARLLTVSAAGNDPNAMWLNPTLADCPSAEEVGRLGAGGIGELRVWQAPEAAPRWQGPPDGGPFPTIAFSRQWIQETTRSASFPPSAAPSQERSRCRTIAPKRADRSRFAASSNSARHRPPGLRGRGACGAALRFHHYFRRSAADDPHARVDLWPLLPLRPETIGGAQLQTGTRPVSSFNSKHIGELDTNDGFLLKRSDGNRMSRTGVRVNDAVG